MSLESSNPDDRTLGIYTGWGPEPEARNQGDELCHRSMVELLGEQGINDCVDLRDSSEPVIQPWRNDLVIGGGTVLPRTFEARTGPGLKASRRIYILGSGCLNAVEVAARGTLNLDTKPFERAKVIGVRGPLSAEHYKHFFDKIVPYIGDHTTLQILLVYSIQQIEHIQLLIGLDFKSILISIVESRLPMI